MKKTWPLIIASIVIFAYFYMHALMLLRLPSGTIIFNDYALLTYTGEAARNFFAQSRTLWGYDPHFMAGYPLTFIWNSNVLTQAACVLLRHADAAVVVRAAAFAGMMFFPLMFYWALRNFDLPRTHAWLGAVLGMLVFRLDVTAMFFMAGMVTAGIITYFGIFLISLIYRFLTRGDAWSAILLIVFSPLALFIHKTVVVIVFVPAVVMIAQYLFGGRKAGTGTLEKCEPVPVFRLRHTRGVKIKTLIILLITAAVTIAANWFWLEPTIKFFHYKTFLSEAPFWQNRDVLRPFKDYFTLSVRANTTDLHGQILYRIVNKAMLWSLVVFGAVGLAAWRREKRPAFAAAAAAVVFLFVFGYYGAFLKLFAEVNPSRYLPVMNLLLLAPACTALAALHKRAGARLGANAAFLIVALGACVVSFYHLGRFDPLLRLRTGAPETREVTELIDTLRSLPNGGRVLLEDSGVMDREGDGQVYALSQLPSQFHELTGKEFIGGPYPYVFLKHHRVDFHDGKFMGRELEDIPFSRFKQYANLYDVKWVVGWSSRAKRYFDAYPDFFLPVRDIGWFRLYMTPLKPDPFLKGSGTVSATYNRFELDDVKPEDGVIVLKYHWLETLRTVPPRKITRVNRMDDPIGFISVHNPPRHFEIVNP